MVAMTDFKTIEPKPGTMSKEQRKSAETCAANDNEKQSIRDWHKNHTTIELHDDAMDTMLKLCDTEEYGENGECEALQNIIREMFYRLSELQTTNTKLLEKVDKLEAENRGLSLLIDDSVKLSSAIIECLRIYNGEFVVQNNSLISDKCKSIIKAEQALKQKS